MNTIAKTSGIIKAPRWFKVPTFLKDLAFMADLEISLQVETGLISETVRYSVEGEHQKILIFRETVEDAIKKYSTN